MDLFFKTGIGQDCHRFLPPDSSKPCVIGGIIFEGESGFNADSDGDVVYHAICKAITSLSGVPILGGIADELCLKAGITDSQVYVEEALKTLHEQQITHVAIALEGKRPLFSPQLQAMRHNIAKVLRITSEQVGITVSSGAGLTDCGCGEGVNAICIITTMKIK